MQLFISTGHFDFPTKVKKTKKGYFFYLQSAYGPHDMVWCHIKYVIQFENVSEEYLLNTLRPLR